MHQVSYRQSFNAMLHPIYGMVHYDEALYHTRMPLRPAASGRFYFRPYIRPTTLKAVALKVMHPPHLPCNTVVW